MVGRYGPSSELFIGFVQLLKYVMDFGCFIAKKREDPGGKKIGNTFFNVLFCNQYNVFDCMNLKNVNVWLVRVMWRRYKQLTRLEVKKSLEIHVAITRECYHHSFCFVFKQLPWWSVSCHWCFLKWIFASDMLFSRFLRHCLTNTLLLKYPTFHLVRTFF